MGSTFLTLTNKAINKVNEIQLTSTTFASTTSGFPQTAKEAILDSIRRINQDQYNWPFNYNTTTQVATVDVATYSFPSDFKTADWNSFFIQKDDALSVGAKNLNYIDYDEWIQSYRAREKELAVGDGGVPERIYRTKDNKFGLSTIPDKAYTIEYGYWSIPIDLSLYTDETTIPTTFDNVIIDGALYYIYLFRSNETAANMANSRFKEGLKQMRSILINAAEYAWDTRTSYELNRSGRRFAASRPI